MMNKTLPCQICSLAFRSNTKLLNHIEAVHEKKKPYSCQIYSATFGWNQSLYRHTRAVHDDNNGNFVCGICKTAFLTKNHLLRHSGKVH